MARRDDYGSVALCVVGVVCCALALAGCDSSAETAARIDAAPPSDDAAREATVDVRPGAGIGTVLLGMRYDQLRALHGELEQVAPFNRFIAGNVPALGVEVLLVSAEANSLSDDAMVIGVGVRATDSVVVHGEARPGMTRSAVEATLGPPPESVEAIDYYPSGISVEYTADAVVKRVGVYAAYQLAPTPPPMQHAPQ